jgi:hypothetical protein
MAYGLRRDADGRRSEARRSTIWTQNGSACTWPETAWARSGRRGELPTATRRARSTANTVVCPLAAESETRTRGPKDGLAAAFWSASRIDGSRSCRPARERIPTLGDGCSRESDREIRAIGRGSNTWGATARTETPSRKRSGQPASSGRLASTTERRRMSRLRGALLGARPVFRLALRLPDQRTFTIPWPCRLVKGCVEAVLMLVRSRPFVLRRARGIDTENMAAPSVPWLADAAAVPRKRHGGKRRGRGRGQAASRSSAPPRRSRASDLRLT